MISRKTCYLGYLFILLFAGLLIVQSVSAEGYWKLTDVSIDSTNGKASSSGSVQMHVDWNQASETSVQGTLTGEKPAVGCTAKVVTLYSWVAPPTILYPNSELTIPYQFEQIACDEKCGGGSDMTIRYTFEKRGTWGLDVYDQDKHKTGIAVDCKNEQFLQNTFLTNTGTAPGSDSDKNRILTIHNRIVNDRYDVNYFYSWIDDEPNVPPQSSSSCIYSPGSVWSVQEYGPMGNYDGIWKVSDDGKSIDASWGGVTDTMDIVSVDGSSIQLYRRGNGGYYSGTLSSDCKSIFGTASWYTDGQTWSASLMEEF